MSSNDESTDLLTRTLTEATERSAPRLVSPRRPLDDFIQDAIREEREHPHQREWAAGDLESGGGRMYVLGVKDGPHFASATWLHSALRPAN
ncbi:MAG: hypothetical protein JWN68_2737 [Nocardioides sp.]|jgi:hypothetical protein|uniref:hypothetical protein n=1 Tax=Nocardioides sp. TaxID=35761 RepID=UPI00260EB90D|nr:hypothetical protein [Nocardioides sp.]MCW2834784.1 hypothetical protein [Nocardioides sp.]